MAKNKQQAKKDAKEKPPPMGKNAKRKLKQRKGELEDQIRKLRRNGKRDEDYELKALLAQRRALGN